MKGFTHEPPAGGPVDWYTPPEIFEKLNIQFDLDVAYPKDKILDWIPTKGFITERSLQSEWHGRVWMNPPYDRHIHLWLEKLSNHGNGIALIWARTDVAWFHTYAPLDTYILFTKNRISFINQEMKRMERPAIGSLFLAFGQECAEALMKSNLGFGMYTPVGRLLKL
jgi:hypothetical protein